VGSITLDLAEFVAPAPVIGIDRDEKQLATARRSAEQRQIKNVTFEVGDVYQLKYPDSAFDAVLAHTLLMHLSDQLKALREMRRVIKPGGVIGVSDDDYGALTISPANSVMHRIFEVWTKYVQINGGSPFYSRHLRGLLREAGFVNTEGHAVAAEYYGTLPETRRFARVVDQLLSDPAVTQIMLTNGLCTQDDLDSMRVDLKGWGENPDAFLSLFYCAAIGWVPD
jgi:SAM-dependent methyltransferase